MARRPLDDLDRLRFRVNFNAKALEAGLEELAPRRLTLDRLGHGTTYQGIAQALCDTGRFKGGTAEELEAALTIYHTLSSPNGKVGRRSLVVEQSSEIVQKKIRWIWKNWLPLRKLTMLDGDPDVGKSTLTIDIAARITTGANMPDGSAGLKGDVIFLSEEDDADDTITWRLDAAGADRDRVFDVHATKDADWECPITIPDDLDLLEEEIKRHETKLVIIDVLDEYLAEKVDPTRTRA